MIKGATILAIGFGLGYTKGLIDAGLFKVLIQEVRDMAHEAKVAEAQAADEEHAKAEADGAIDAEADEEPEIIQPKDKEQGDPS